MQIMAEALGLMLPGSALMPATCDGFGGGGPPGRRQAPPRWPAWKASRARDMVTDKEL